MHTISNGNAFHMCLSIFVLYSRQPLKGPLDNASMTKSLQASAYEFFSSAGISFDDTNACPLLHTLHYTYKPEHACFNVHAPYHISLVLVLY